VLDPLYGPRARLAALSSAYEANDAYAKYAASEAIKANADEDLGVALDAVDALVAENARLSRQLDAAQAAAAKAHAEARRLLVGRLRLRALAHDRLAGPSPGACGDTETHMALAAECRHLMCSLERVEAMVARPAVAPAGSAFGSVPDMPERAAEPLDASWIEARFCSTM